MNETSQMLFLRPELVRSGYRTAPAQAGTDWRQLVDKGATERWPGYFGSPALATAARGAVSLQASSKDLADLAVRILDGLDHRTLQRQADAQLTDEAITEYNAAADVHAQAVQEKQSAWLRQKGIR
jgi:hypothetical protein